MIVADFSMNNGRENRNNGNQEKGKKEKEALRKSVRSQKGGRRKRPLSFCREFGALRRNSFFLCWAQSTEGTEITVKARFRFEIACSDTARHSQHPFSRSLQLELRPFRENGDVAFEIMEDECVGAVPPLFARGHSIDRKLETFVGVLLRAGFAGLVVDDVYAVIGSAVDPIDAAGNLRPGDLHVEPLFSVHDLGCWS